MAMFLMFSFNVFSQSNTDSTKTGQFRFAYGQVYNLKIDKTYSRLAKNGSTHYFDMGYYRINNNRVFELSANFRTGRLQTQGNDRNIILNYAGNLRFKYLKKNQKLNTDKWSLYLGGNFGFRADSWFPNNSELRYAWDIYIGAGLSTSILYKTNSKFSFKYDLDIPLIGILGRSRNNGQQLISEEVQLENGLLATGFENAFFSHPFNTLYIDNSFLLLYRASKRIVVYYNFGLLYVHLKKPLIKKGYEFNNSLGINFKF